MAPFPLVWGATPQLCTNHVGGRGHKAFISRGSSPKFLPCNKVLVYIMAAFNTANQM